MDKLISLQDAIKAIEEKAKRIKNEDTLNGLAGAVGILFDLPSVRPQEPTGHWIVDVDRWGDVVTTVNGYRCDKCNAFNSDKDNYCPNCGAKMIDEQESEVKHG